MLFFSLLHKAEKKDRGDKTCKTFNTVLRLIVRSCHIGPQLMKWFSLSQRRVGEGRLQHHLPLPLAAIKLLAPCCHSLLSGLSAAVRGSHVLHLSNTLHSEPATQPQRSPPLTSSTVCSSPLPKEFQFDAFRMIKSRDKWDKLWGRKFNWSEKFP